MPSAPDAPSLRRARWALLAQFALFGLIMTSWTSRLPSVTVALDLTPAGLGGLLFIGGLGTLVGAFTVGAVVARFGNRITLTAGVAGNVVGFGLLALSTATASPGLFAAGAVVNGFCAAMINVPINVNAAAVERRLGRTVLPQFHATFSIGAAVGALIGAAFAWLGLHLAIQLIVVTVLVTAARVWLIRPATLLTSVLGVGAGSSPTAAAATADSVAATTTGSLPVLGPAAMAAAGRGRARSAFGAWLEPRTLLLGVVLLAASLTEGSANTWLAISMVDGFAATEAVGAVAYGTFVLAMTVFRFLGTGLIDRYGRVPVLRASSAVSLVGLLAFVLAPALPIAWIGIVLWGCGAALGNPIAIAAASDDPAKAGPRLSVVTSFSTVAALAAPPLLGLLADSIGPRHALLAIGGFMVVSLLLADQVRRRPLPGVRWATDAPAATDAPTSTDAPADTDISITSDVPADRTRARIS